MKTITMQENNLYEYIVVQVYPEAPNVMTIALTLADGSVPSFVPGQYINVYFPETDTPEGKAYSISSAPHDAYLTITVRDIGEFSHRLATLEVGNRIMGSLPYGFFYAENGESDLVLLAGGIGITPFRSMVRHAAEHHPNRRIHLFHSIRSKTDAVFEEEFKMLKEELGAFGHTHFITRELVEETEETKNGRLNVDTILQAVADPSHTEFLICGSISFTRDLWRSLRQAGVPEEQLYTEAFFTHS